MKMNISGKVIKGRGRGKELLGFATANMISDDESLIRKLGCWFAKVNVKHGTYKSVSCISRKGEEFLIETHILDFDYDIYDKEINLKLVYKIRDNITFKSLDESRDQIIKDISFVNNYRVCSDCQLCVKQDNGYSNYTVEGTTIYCLVNKFDEYEESYNDNYRDGFATNCDLFVQGDCWELDVDGYNEGPTDDWIKSTIRDLKINNILK